MIVKAKVAFLLVLLLTILPSIASSQFDPGEMPAWIIEILDLDGTRLGTVVVPGHSDRGYQAGTEYWRFDENALLKIAELSSLEFAVLASGDWDTPWVMDALAWQPENGSVEWSHPSVAEWTPLRASDPPVAEGGTYFGNATLGGLTVQYSPEGPASLTWFKLTEGNFMQLEDGALFERNEEPPTAGSWWHGPIEPMS